MLLSHGLRVLQIALAAACLFMVYAGLTPVLNASTVDSVVVPGPREPTPRDASFARYLIIGQSNLFAKPAGDEGPAPAPAPVEDAVIEETKLPLALHGTIAMKPEPLAVASLENTRTRERFAVRVGDELKDVGAGPGPPAQVKRIERKRVIVEYQGRLEAITMDDDDARATVRPTTSRPPRAARPARAPRRAGAKSREDRIRELRERAARASTPSPNRPDEDAALPLSARPKLTEMMSAANPMPAFDEDGNFEGLSLNNIRPGGAFDGLAEGTVCFELNGQPFSGGVHTLPTALSSIGDGEACLTCRQPDGTETTRCF